MIWRTRIELHRNQKPSQALIRPSGRVGCGSEYIGGDRSQWVGVGVAAASDPELAQRLALMAVRYEGGGEPPRNRLRSEGGAQGEEESGIRPAGGVVDRTEQSAQV